MPVLRSTPVSLETQPFPRIHDDSLYFMIGLIGKHNVKAPGAVVFFGFLFSGVIHIQLAWWVPDLGL